MIATVNEAGKEVVSPKYDGVGLFDKGFAWVKLKDKYGFVNEAGKEVVPPMYDSVEVLNKGFARVELNGKFYREMLNKNL